MTLNNDEQGFEPQALLEGHMEITRRRKEGTHLFVVVPRNLPGAGSDSTRGMRDDGGK